MACRRNVGYRTDLLLQTRLLSSFNNVFPLQRNMEGENLSTIAIGVQILPLNQLGGISEVICLMRRYRKIFHVHHFRIQIL